LAGKAWQEIDLSILPVVTMDLTNPTSEFCRLLC
jgi:hypothetical protein